MNLKPYTKLETCDIMITETTNALTKDEIMERLMQRIMLVDSSQAIQNQLGSVQSRIKQFKKTLKDLASIRDSIAKESESAIV